jgi:hypothetical protein
MPGAEKAVTIKFEEVVLKVGIEGFGYFRP